MASSTSENPQQNPTVPTSAFGEQQRAIQEAQRTKNSGNDSMDYPAFRVNPYNPGGNAHPLPPQNVSGPVTSADFGGNNITITPYPQSLQPSDASTKPPKASKSSGRRGK